MARQIGGIEGVLGEYISPEPPPKPASKLTPPAKPKPDPPVKQPADTRPRTRTGRRPGSRPAEAARRRKVTVWVDGPLMDEYRDWSWDARCNLGELVERALLEYRDNHR